MCLRDRQPNALLRGIITFWVGEQNTLRFAILCLWKGGRLSYLKRLCFMNLPQILAVQIFTWPWSLATKLVQVYTSISVILQYLEEVERPFLVPLTQVPLSCQRPVVTTIRGDNFLAYLIWVVLTSFGLDTFTSYYIVMLAQSSLAEVIDANISAD
jgi:hypothetical protein